MRPSSKITNDMWYIYLAAQSEKRFALGGHENKVIVSKRIGIHSEEEISVRIKDSETLARK